MIGHWVGQSYIEPPADNPDDIALYKVHVANGTVPKKGIPYTRRAKPVRKIPSASIDMKDYIRRFERLNHLKEIPQ